MKLKEWAEKAGVKYLTAYRWFKAGTLPVNAYQTSSGTIIVEEELESEKQDRKVKNNSAMSLFLKKTVEFSKNNVSVEDFAAWILANFSISIIEDLDTPKYSRQKPKSEDVQKHFQQFLQKGEKPKPHSFVMDPKQFDDISGINSAVMKTDIDQELLSEFTQAVETPDTPLGYVSTYNPVAASTPGAAAGSMSTEGMITQSVDLDTAPQLINYTGSNNFAFSSSLTSAPTYGTVNTISMVDSAHASGIDTYCSAPTSELYFTNSSDGSAALGGGSSTFQHYFEQLDETLESKTSAKLALEQPRSKRGRKPRKE